MFWLLGLAAGCHSLLSVSEAVAIIVVLVKMTQKLLQIWGCRWGSSSDYCGGEWANVGKEDWEPKLVLKIFHGDKSQYSQWWKYLLSLSSEVVGKERERGWERVLFSIVSIDQKKGKWSSGHCRIDHGKLTFQYPRFSTNWRVHGEGWCGPRKVSP